MDQQTERIFADNEQKVLSEASKRYGMAPDSLKRLGSFESFVFEYRYQDTDQILRVTPGSHRQATAIKGELEWVNYLADNGVSVCRGLPSKNGSLVEVIELDTIDSDPDAFYSVVSFTKAPGRRAIKEDWNEKLFTNWGQVIGRMHALTKNYQPSDPSLVRHVWHEDGDLRADRYLPESQTKVLARHADLMDYLHKLPMDTDSFGLVHEDMHHGNFFVDNGSITVFDFDDCQHHWFASDLAMPLFYVMRNLTLNDQSLEFAHHFFGCLMEGYSRENRIEKYWLEQIPHFLKLREMILYIILYAEEAFEANEWCRAFFSGRRERIENGVPVLDMDFGQFA
ncbi:MAG: phosphotransferase [Candidatus Zixiibacteriota bacterium]